VQVNIWNNSVSAMNYFLIMTPNILSRTIKWITYIWFHIDWFDWFYNKERKKDNITHGPSPCVNLHNSMLAMNYFDSNRTNTVIFNHLWTVYTRHLANSGQFSYPLPNMVHPLDTMWRANSGQLPTPVRTLPSTRKHSTLLLIWSASCWSNSCLQHLLSCLNISPVCLHRKFNIYAKTF
jgi:hypothetical protein